MRASVLYRSLLVHVKCARRAVLARLEPRLHRGGLRRADERRVVVDRQLFEVLERYDRLRESSELAVIEGEPLQARQLQGSLTPGGGRERARARLK